VAFNRHGCVKHKMIFPAECKTTGVQHCGYYHTVTQDGALAGHSQRCPKPPLNEVNTQLSS